MTLEAAGAAVGVSHSSWSEWESGSRIPSLEKALAVEAFTEGTVTVEDWRFNASVIPTARRVIERRDAVADELTTDRGPEYAQPVAEVA